LLHNNTGAADQPSNNRVGLYSDFHLRGAHRDGVSTACQSPDARWCRYELLPVSMTVG
jgi:hypothetical protein